MTSVTTLLCMVTVWYLVTGYPNVVPPTNEVCREGIPNHKTTIPFIAVGKLRQIPAQFTTSPYSLTVNTTVVRPHEPVGITLSASDAKASFRGFLIQVLPKVSGPFSLDERKPIGKLIPIGRSRLVDCFPEGDMISHTEPSRKFNVTVLWIAPSKLPSSLHVHATVVQDFETYWENTRSPIITSPEGREVTPNRRPMLFPTTTTTPKPVAVRKPSPTIASVSPTSGTADREAMLQKARELLQSSPETVQALREMLNDEQPSASEDSNSNDMLSSLMGGINGGSGGLASMMGGGGGSSGLMSALMGGGGLASMLGGGGGGGGGMSNMLMASMLGGGGGLASMMGGGGGDGGGMSSMMRNLMAGGGGGGGGGNPLASLMGGGGGGQGNPMASLLGGGGMGGNSIANMLQGGGGRNPMAGAMGRPGGPASPMPSMASLLAGMNGGQNGGPESMPALSNLLNGMNSNPESETPTAELLDDSTGADDLLKSVLGEQTAENNDLSSLLQNVDVNKLMQSLNGAGNPMMPNMQQPGMQQPGMQQPGMQQPRMQQPGRNMPPQWGNQQMGRPPNQFQNQMGNGNFHMPMPGQMSNQMNPWGQPQMQPQTTANMGHQQFGPQGMHQPQFSSQGNWGHPGSSHVSWNNGQPQNNGQSQGQWVADKAAQIWVPKDH
ncbi:hypothetical protein ScPMuIL_008032 [Solemya velum]